MEGIWGMSAQRRTSISRMHPHWKVSCMALAINGTHRNLVCNWQRRCGGHNNKVLGHIRGENCLQGYAIRAVCDTFLTNRISLVDDFPFERWVTHTSVRWHKLNPLDQVRMAIIPLRSSTIMDVRYFYANVAFQGSRRVFTHGSERRIWRSFRLITCTLCTRNWPRWGCTTPQAED